MKPLLLLGCTLLATTALHAQFQFLPYAGFEQSRTTVNTNTLSVPDINGFLRAGLRTSYGLKGGHSLFVSVATNPAPVHFSFDNTGALLNQFRTSNLQLRLEAGYGFNSKPIQLGKGRSPRRMAAPSAAQTTTRRKSCGSTLYRSSCGGRKTKMLTAPANGTLNMRLQPALALAYLPSSTPTVVRKGSGFDYTPSWKAAVVPSLGFEFAKGTERLFTLGVFYTAPVGVKEEAVTTAVESKTITSRLQPQLATWGVTLGLPFNTSKATKAKASPAKAGKRGCSRNYYRQRRIL